MRSQWKDVRGDRIVDGLGEGAAEQDELAVDQRVDEPLVLGRG
jgi:hypothetical protein